MIGKLFLHQLDQSTTTSTDVYNIWPTKCSQQHDSKHQNYPEMNLLTSQNPNDHPRDYSHHLQPINQWSANWANIPLTSQPHPRDVYNPWPTNSTTAIINSGTLIQKQILSHIFCISGQNWMPSNLLTSCLMIPPNKGKNPLSQQKLPDT